MTSVDVYLAPTDAATKWTLENSVELIRLLQPLAHRHGYHLALAGGILNRGFSEKDLDVVALPNFNAEQEWEALQADIEDTLAAPLRSIAPSETAYLPFRVYVASHKNGRIDVIRHEGSR
jgi:hypothetical protein